MLRRYYPLDSAAFKAWLSENSGEVVGITCRSSKCPIANFVTRSLNPKYRVLVDDAQVIRCRKEDDHVNRVFPLPKWARIFIREIDGCGMPGTPITGLAALAALETAAGAEAH